MANIWGYRIDNNKAKFFYTEIQKGILRQGWGYKTNHNLRLGKTNYRRSCKGKFFNF